MSYLGHDEYGYNDYASNSNSFKTIFRGETKSFHKNDRNSSAEAGLKSVINTNKVEDFPTLGKLGSSVVAGVTATNNYKSAVAKQVIQEVEYVEVVPPGWVKYTFNKTTKQMVEKKGEEVDPPSTKEEEDDDVAHQKLMSMLQKNRERHRKSFIACHGEEYYKDYFFIPRSYGETDSSSDASDYEQ